jgi:hypothetical protein
MGEHIAGSDEVRGLIPLGAVNKTPTIAGWCFSFESITLLNGPYLE